LTRAAAAEAGSDDEVAWCACESGFELQAVQTARTIAVRIPGRLLLGASGI
jgi:hypothetical protein